MVQKRKRISGFAVFAAVLAVLAALAACDNAALQIKEEGQAQERLAFGNGADAAVNQKAAGVKEVDFVVPFLTPTLEEAFNDIAENTSETNFLIVLVDDVTSGAIDVTDARFAGKFIEIQNFPIAAGYAITLDEKTPGALFTLGSAEKPVTLTVGNSVTLHGVDNNESALVVVNGGGVFNLTENAVITGNGNAADNPTGGGVYVNGGAFSMTGGLITKNMVQGSFTYDSTGGGVYVADGTFTMSDGTITGNEAVNPNGRGGGIYISGGSVTLSGAASITGNTVTLAGGGVYVAGGLLTMNGGGISANNSVASGGGVDVDGGAFIMNNGKILNNTVTSPVGSAYGGGVYAENKGTFTMDGGIISGNTAETVQYTAGGGGAGVSTGGVFQFNGGEISGNTALASSTFSAVGKAFGGGIFAGIHTASFTMKGGVIQGNTVSNANSNAKETDAGGGGVGLDTGLYSSVINFEKTGGTIAGNKSASPNQVIIEDTPKQSGYGCAVRAGYTYPSPRLDNWKDGESGAPDNLTADYDENTGWSYTGVWDR
jgi:hypothetical protein